MDQSVDSRAKTTEASKSGKADMHGVSQVPHFIVSVLICVD
jgi:hypothetical protein